MTMSDDPRPLGAIVPDWHAPPPPSGEVLEGRFACLEPLRADDHAALLFPAFEGHDAHWDYMPYGPFASASDYRRWVEDVAGLDDPFFYAIKDKETGRFGGVASYLRIAPQAGTIEVGHINLSPLLQRSRAATEAMYLLMAWAFAAGYRRYEWKCDALNRPSRRAAQRLGFSYEGIFRQAGVVKGRNRDTAWFAATDGDWPGLRAAFETWLAPENFDAAGQQRQSLSGLSAPVRVAADPDF